MDFPHKKRLRKYLIKFVFANYLVFAKRKPNPVNKFISLMAYWAGAFRNDRMCISSHILHRIISVLCCCHRLSSGDVQVGSGRFRCNNFHTCSRRLLSLSARDVDTEFSQQSSVSMQALQVKPQAIFETLSRSFFIVFKSIFTKIWFTFWGRRSVHNKSMNPATTTVWLKKDGAQ